MYNNISKTANDLIYLLSCAVNNQIPDKEKCLKMDFEKLYKLAKFHSLCSITASALEQADLIIPDFVQAKKKAIRKLSLFDIERRAILNEFEKTGIWYLPLKGILFKDIYPKQSYREMIDNDILCDGSKMTQIREIMESRGYTCTLYAKSNHDVYSKPPTVEFEIHKSLFPDDDKNVYYNYYNDIKPRLIKDSGNSFGYHMTDEDFYIFVLAHIKKHYDLSGTGLRSLLDVYVLNKKYRVSLNRDYIDSELEKLNMIQFEFFISELSQKVFTNQPLSESEQKQLAYFIKSGSQGTLEEHYRIKLKNDDSKRSKRRYLMSRFTLSESALKQNHPFFYRHRAMYPLLLVYRPIKGVLTHPKTIVKEYKQIKNLKSDNSGGRNE